MKNSYIVNGQIVIDIIHKQTKHSKHRLFFVLENGDHVVALNTKIKIRCSECGKYIDQTYANRYENKEYLCNSCRTKGKRNPFYGKKHSDEFKQRLSDERLGIWCVGENNSMYGKNAEDFMTESAIKEKRRKQSAAIRGTKNGMYGRSIKDLMSKEDYEVWRQKKIDQSKNYTDEQRQAISKKISISQMRLKKLDPVAYRNMKAKGGLATKSKAVTYKKTKPEIKVENWLIDHHVNYDYSCIMGCGERCYQYDFIIHNKRILIEVQGDYWHGNPLKFNLNGTNGRKKLNDIQLKNKRKDICKKRFAREKKFKLICIWESDINNNNFSKLDTIIG